MGRLAIVVVMIAACGTLQGPRTGVVSPPTDALARWSDFPANEVPRPIVLLGERTLASGTTTGDGKLAYICGRFHAGFVPSTDAPPQATAIGLDGVKVSYPAISAADALAEMSAAPNTQMPSCGTAWPLELTAARFGSFGFETDRGLMQMSAWLFTAGTLDLAHAALAPSAFWKLGSASRSIGGAATISPDGRVMTFSFIGGPPDGACAVDYTGVVAESPAAVAVAVQSSPGRTVAGPIACTAEGHIRSITVTLKISLGGRVVVDASGAAVPVCPDSVRGPC